MTEHFQLAFEKLKIVVVSAPVLQLPDFSNNIIPFLIFLMELTPRIQQQSTYVRELYVVTEVVRKFRHYLLGHQFIIRTDQEALKHLWQ